MGAELQLPKLIRWRRAERDARSVELEAALAAEQLLRRQLAELEQQQLAVQQAARQTIGPGSVDPADATRAACFRAHLRSCVATLTDQLAAASGDVEQARGRLLESQQALKMLERLSERRRQTRETTRRRRDEAELSGKTPEFRRST